MRRLLCWLFVLTAATSAFGEVTVTGVAGLKSRLHKGLQFARLGEPVWVQVSDYPQLQKDAGDKPITLWLGGRDTKIEVEEANATSGWMRFYLDRLDDKETGTDNRDLWASFLRDPFRPTFRVLTVSVGPAGGKPLAAAKGLKNEIRLLKVEVLSVRGMLWILFLGAALFAFVRLARQSDILRNGPTLAGQKQAYSLGRTQMAWWFFLILNAFVFIWLVSGDSSTITPSLLALMGISAGTALGSVAIDSSSTSTMRTRLQDEQTRLSTELATVQTALTAGGAAVAPALTATETTLKNRIAEVDQALLAVNTAPKSKNWLFDILTDDDGTIAFHRFQIVVWTIVLGLMFLTSVTTRLTMPEFNGTLLALMGISAGTYLGFKVPSQS